MAREVEHAQKMQISQEELAERADLHRNYVGSIERGERDIGITALASLWKSSARDSPRA